MKIVHVSDYFHPELGYQDTFLALVELEQGHQVEVITSDRYRPFEDYEHSMRPLLGPRIRKPGFGTERGILVHRLPTRVEARFRTWLVHLTRTVATINPDVVIVHGVGSSSAVRLARWKRRVRRTGRVCFRLVIDDHMVTFGDGELEKKLFYAAFRRLFRALLLEEADGLVAVSEATKDFMVAAYGFPSERIEVIPLGVYTALFERDEVRGGALRRSLGITDQDVVFLHCGKLVPSKAPHVLVEAAARAMIDTPQLRVVLIGDGPPDYVEAMKQTAAVSGYPDRFSWLPAVGNEELPAYYSLADVGVWPARSSLAMIEAQACGLPIIVSTFAAAAERVQRGNGLVFPEGDLEALARCMRELALDGGARRTMSERGRRLVESSWDYRALSDRFLSLGSPG